MYKVNTNKCLFGIYISYGYDKKNIHIHVFFFSGIIKTVLDVTLQSHQVYISEYA